MKSIQYLALGILLAGSLTACSRNNTLPPVPYYPNSLVNAQQNDPNFGRTNQVADPLSNNTLPSDVTLGQEGSIVGQVISRMGQPLHNVEVSLQSNPEIKTTSKRGEFTLMNIPAGPQVLVFTFGNIQTTAQVNVLPNRAVPPMQNPVRMEGEIGSKALEAALPNKQIGAFKVDQDSLLNLWQPVGLAASGGTLYISAIDTRSLITKGTVIKMNTSEGKEWKNLASAWLGLRHPLNGSTRGMTLNSAGQIVVVDEKGGTFSVESSNGKVTKADSEGALDIASGGGKTYIYGIGGIAESDETGATRTPISGVNASGGIAADKEGNGYVPVQNTLYKISAGKPSVLIDQYLNSPKDVAIDNRNGDIYVLDGGEIKRFDKKGEFIVNFGTGGLNAVALTLDEEGTLFVADFGRDHRSAQIIKFEAAPLVNANSVTTAPAADEALGTEAAPTEELPTEDLPEVDPTV
jgi:hypothetical protein